MQDMKIQLDLYGGLNVNYLRKEKSIFPLKH